MMFRGVTSNSAELIGTRLVGHFGDQQRPFVDGALADQAFAEPQRRAWPFAPSSA